MVRIDPQECKGNPRSWNVMRTMPTMVSRLTDNQKRHMYMARARRAIVLDYIQQQKEKQMPDKITIVTPDGTEVTVDLERAQELLDADADAFHNTRVAVQSDFNVSQMTASAITYLRTRSRWSQEKEQELIDRDHAGDPIPLNTVLSGDF